MLIRQSLSELALIPTISAKSATVDNDVAQINQKIK